jgi:GntR family transcriptional regulator
MPGKPPGNYANARPTLPNKIPITIFNFIVKAFFSYAYCKVYYCNDSVKIMQFDITPNAPTPIYRQIIEQVRRLVASGQLPPGEAMPSVRAVALEHAINPMTVSKAYSQLEAEGLLERHRGMGMLVADVSQSKNREDTLVLLRPSLEAAAKVAAQLGVTPDEASALFRDILSNNETDSTSTDSTNTTDTTNNTNKIGSQP